MTSRALWPRRGAAYCWGDNDHGQLGDGTTTPHSFPAPVAGGLTFKSIAVGDAHVCGVTTSGAVYCWGFSSNGAFGDGSEDEHLTPTAGAPGLAFQSVVAGSDFTCGLTTTGTAYCWGLGQHGPAWRRHRPLESGSPSPYPAD